MVESFNVVQISSPKKEQFRVYSTTRYLGFETTSIKGKSNKVENRLRSNFRAKRRIQELLDINFADYFSLMTLTFKENIVDISVANTTFTRFIKRLKRYLVKKGISSSYFKYLCVVEAQKRGAIHYHVVNNLPEPIMYLDIINIWNDTIYKNDSISIKGGSVHIDYSQNDTYLTDNMSRYLGKYLLKNEVNPIFLGKKMYFSSRNLKKPVRNNYYKKFNTLEEPDVIGFLESDFSISLSGKKLFKKDVYYDKYSGEKILFLEYQ